MRQIILDTETTGLNPRDGERIIEIGCVELLNRRLTGNHYHQYIQPNKIVDPEAIKVHGITNEFLADKPLMAAIVDEFLAYVKGAELVIHNAPFDVGFINHELKMLGAKYGRIEDYCTILDTLVMARKKHPGQRNSLDALCKRYEVSNAHRDLHGALLDSEILADVYLAMTSGQAGFEIEVESQAAEQKQAEHNHHHSSEQTRQFNLINFQLTESEEKTHRDYLTSLKAQSGECVWDVSE